ncbi:tail fiber assembly protein [Klebsiella sp. Ap-873]|nr:tail fiber assembly protein [Klebsiella sp. Ap-873]
MNKYKWSAKHLAFFPESWLSSYESAGWDLSDLVDVSDDVYMSFTSPPPSGKTLGAKSGMPAWVDIPPPTHDELVAIAEAEKQQRIEQANEFINNKQWPGKAVMGRLKDAEKVQYNLWLDYLDALDAIDTSSAPGIKWPTQPVSPAN